MSELNPDLVPSADRTAHQQRLIRAAMALMALGVSRPQTQALIAQYDLERIERQLRFLPHRSARKPSALIVAAIEEDYEPPTSSPIERDDSAEEDRLDDRRSVDQRSLDQRFADEHPDDPLPK